MKLFRWNNIWICTSLITEFSWSFCVEPDTIQVTKYFGIPNNCRSYWLLVHLLWSLLNDRVSHCLSTSNEWVIVYYEDNNEGWDMNEWIGCHALLAPIIDIFISSTSSLHRSEFITFLLWRYRGGEEKIWGYED